LLPILLYLQIFVVYFIWKPFVFYFMGRDEFWHFTKQSSRLLGFYAFVVQLWPFFTRPVFAGTSGAKKILTFKKTNQKFYTKVYLIFSGGGESRLICIPPLR